MQRRPSAFSSVSKPSVKTCPRSIVPLNTSSASLQVCQNPAAKPHNTHTVTEWAGAKISRQTDPREEQSSHCSNTSKRTKIRDTGPSHRQNNLREIASSRDNCYRDSICIESNVKTEKKEKKKTTTAKPLLCVALTKSARPCAVQVRYPWFKGRRKR